MTGRTPTPFDLAEEELKTLQQLLDSSNHVTEYKKKGEIINARLIKIEERKLYFDISDKQEGVCSRDEFDEIPAIGEIVSVAVRKKNPEGFVNLSKKEAERQNAWKILKEASKTNTNLTGEVSKVLPAGYLLQYKGLELFLPLSHSSLRPQNRFTTGASLDFRILKLKEQYYSAVVSHRKIIEEKNDSLWDAFLKKHQEGDIVEGIIIQKVSFGIFVEVDGIIGLLHQNDISWKEGFVITKSFSIHSKIKLKILSMDPKNNRLGLGLKQLSEEPWKWVETNLKVDQKIHAKVSSLTPYGAFLEIREGLQGLSHISDISWERKPKHPKNYIQLNQEVEAKVLSINIEEKRISLGIKQCMEDPWKIISQEVKEGDILERKILSVVQFGSFVSIRKGIDGLIHFRDYSWNEPNDPKMLKKGQIVKFKILQVDAENKRIACGLKQLEDNPYISFEKKYPKGSIVKGKVHKVASFGILVQLENNLTGLIADFEASEAKQKEMHKNYKKGDPVETAVLYTDPDKKRIRLSNKVYKEKKENEATQHYIKSEHMPATFNPFANLLSQEKK